MARYYERSAPRGLEVDVMAFKANHHWGNNSYIVSKDGEAIVIDVSSQSKRINAYLSAHNLKLVGVLATHSHCDHLGQSRKVARPHGVKIHIHEGERILLARGRLAIDCSPILRLKDLMLRRVLNELMRVDMNDFTFFTESFRLGGIDVAVRHVPGHTAGSTIFEIGGYWFTGDALFTDNHLYYHVPESNKLQGKLTAQQIFNATVNPVVMPGHGPYGRTLSHIQATNRYLRREAGVEVGNAFVTDRPARGQPAEALAEKPEEPKP